MRNDDALFDTAVQTLRDVQPTQADLSAAALRIADRIGVDATGIADSRAAKDEIRGCSDIQLLLPAYRAATLRPAQALLVQAHLRECGSCLRCLQAGAETTAVDWSPPKIPLAPSPRVWGWALSSAFALLALSFLLYRIYWQIPPGVRAEVRSIDGPAYRVSDAGDSHIAPGDSLGEGEQLRTAGGGHVVLRLADGSIVEMNERSAVKLSARGRNASVVLDHGDVILQAARRAAGHLYVQTPDCRVAVTGTIFSVDSGLKGSRVAVLEGSLHVMHAGEDHLLQAGEQVSTSKELSTEPVGQQIAWSQDRDKYLQLIAQFSALQHRFDLIPAPQLRYSSDLLERVPANTLLYISIPNFGDFLSQANTIFHDQLKQSPVLDQWWASKKGANTEQLDAMVERLHVMSQYLGDEVVVIGLKQSADPGFAILADVQKRGLGDFLNQQISATSKGSNIILLDEKALAGTAAPDRTQPAVYALVRDHEAVFSNSIATLKQVNAQLNAGPSGFAKNAFGQQIGEAYSRGAGIVLAADLHQMIESGGAAGRPNLAKSGMDGLRYLIAEHREQNGLPENHLDLQFSGTRERVASWLAAPASMASLSFVTPNAALAVAVLAKDPTAIADDILTMAAGSQQDALSEVQSKLNISLRDDLAANLGGEFLISLDGAVLPTPAWKAVIEVSNATALERTMETLAQSTCQLQQGAHPRCLTIQSSEASGRHFYSIINQAMGSTVAEYTFADGYMLMTPDHALLLKALHAHASGDSLAHSDAFKATLPQDENDNYSAIAYQNAGPMLTPLLSQVNSDTAAALEQLTADAKPTAICAWGKDTHIEAASKSRLFGFDFLALGSLLNPGNKHGDRNVAE